MPGSRRTTRARTRRTSCGSFGLGAPIWPHDYPGIRGGRSGRKGADKRKQFAALFEDAAKRKFDCVLFWALDRFSREGMAQTSSTPRLTSYGVTFHSYTEPHLATDNELVRNILLALLSSLAKVEAQKISERTKAGMARAKAKVSRSAARSLALRFDSTLRSGRPRARRLRHREGSWHRSAYRGEICERGSRERLQFTRLICERRNIAKGSGIGCFPVKCPYPDQCCRNVRKFLPWRALAC